MQFWGFVNNEVMSCNKISAGIAIPSGQLRSFLRSAENAPLFFALRDCKQASKQASINHARFAD